MGMAHRDEVRHLLQRSREFQETAKYQLNNGFFGLAAFSLEQSLQLHLRAKLLENGVDYPRHHSVRTLIEMLEEVADNDTTIELKNIKNKYLLELGILEDAYISSRYLMREFKKEEVEKLKKAVEDVIKNVK